MPARASFADYAITHACLWSCRWYNMAEPIWIVSADVHYYDNYVFLHKSEACIVMVVAMFMENIGKWLRPQKPVDAEIRESKPAKVGSCWLASQHYLLYSSLQPGSLLLQNSDGSHSVCLFTNKFNEFTTQFNQNTIFLYLSMHQNKNTVAYLWHEKLLQNDLREASL